jgi:hypothetical protein
MATTNTTLPFATDMGQLLFAQSTLKGIDLALGEELQKAAIAAAPPTTTSTLPDQDQDDRTTPIDAIVVSPRVAEELTQAEVMQAVKEVLGYSFPKPTSGPDDISVFSGYIFVGGKQVTWTRHLCNRMGGSRITLSMREEKDALLSSCLDAKTIFALQ